MQSIHFTDIKYLEVGDTFHETGYGQCLNLRIIEKPVYSAEKFMWTWKAFNIDTYKVVDYLMTDEGSNYIHIYFSDETYQRILDMKSHEFQLSGMQDWQKDVLTLNRDTIQQVMKDAKKKLIDSSRYTYKVTEDVVRTDDGQILYRKSSIKPKIVGTFNSADYEVGGKYYIDPATMPF